MAKRIKDAGCCKGVDKDLSCCKVESVVSIDERGQMVIPKEVREKSGIKTGDKLALVSWERGGKVCCISLIKAENLAEMVKGLLGPVMGGILQG